MSKKSVSDIMKPVVIFPNDQSTYMTSRFEVRNHPIVLRAFGIDCDTVGHIEMGYNDGCGGWFWGPYIPDCDQLALLGCANAIAIGLPGWYRIVFRDRITREPSTGLDDLVVTVTETDMPASMLAQFSGGSASMACGSQVSIREEDGCFYISVDNQAYTICPGDSVSCDPNGLGIVINGELCPFPQPQEVSASVENGCLTIVIDGESYTLCDTDSVTLVSLDREGNYKATNPDGSEVNWKMTHVSANGDGTFTATHQDGSTVTWVGTDTDTDSVTLVDDLGEGQYRATNPDGSAVTWNGNDSITLIDALDGGLYRATNPDGSVVEWRQGEPAPSLCDSPTVPELQAGDGIVTCRDGSTVLVDPNAFFQDVCFNDVPDMGTVCAVGQQLTLWDDDGCMRLGRISPASVQVMESGFHSVTLGRLPVNTSGYSLPADFVDDELFYTVGTHTSDGGVDPVRYTFPNGVSIGNRRAAPNMDEARIMNSRIARFEGTSFCYRLYDWNVRFTAGDVEEATFEQLRDRRVTVGVRLRQLVGTMADFGPWLYAFAPGSGSLALTGVQNSIGTTAELSGNLILTAGDYEIEFYYVTAFANNPYVAQANTNTSGYAAWTPEVTLRPRITS